MDDFLLGSKSVSWPEAKGGEKKAQFWMGSFRIFGNVKMRMCYFTAVKDRHYSL